MVGPRRRLGRCGEAGEAWGLSLALAYGKAVGRSAALREVDRTGGAGDGAAERTAYGQSGVMARDAADGARSRGVRSVGVCGPQVPLGPADGPGVVPLDIADKGIPPSSVRGALVSINNLGAGMRWDGPASCR